MIKYFNTEAEYAAATKSNFESEIALVGESNQVHFDGRNVVVGAKSAKTGSIVVLDGNSAMHFVSPETFSSTSFMSNYTVIGVVAVGVEHEDFRGKLVVVHKTNAAKQWCPIYSWRLSGYTCDSTDRTGIISIRSASDSWAANVDYTVNYNAASVADLVNQLNAFFQDTTNTVFQTQNWSAIGVDTDNDNVLDAIDIKCLYSAWYQSSYNTGKTGFSMSANFLPDIAASSNMLRYNGYRSSDGAISIWYKAVAYFSQDLNSTSNNPSSDVTTVKLRYPICKPAYLGTSSYQSDHCAYLRSIYGDGEIGWLKFMKSCLPVRPTSYGPMGDKDTYGDGLTNTYLMAGKTYTKQDNTTIAAFPAADYCASVVYNHELLKTGCWHLPDVDTLAGILSTIQYGSNASRDADLVNKALYAVGGTAISNASLWWSSSRYNATNAWYGRGINGYWGGDNVFTTYQALPVVLLDVNDSEL